jgi:hypothetical protein
VTSIYSHPNEVWALETSPVDTSLVITSGNGIYNDDHKSIGSSVNLFKMPNQTDDVLRDGGEHREAAYAGEKMDLQCLASFDCASNAIVNTIKWNKVNQVVTSDSQFVSLYSVDSDAVKVSWVLPVAAGVVPALHAGLTLLFCSCMSVGTGPCQPLPGLGRSA